jgi:hypothetical protein
MAPVPTEKERKSMARTHHDVTPTPPGFDHNLSGWDLPPEAPIRPGRYVCASCGADAGTSETIAWCTAGLVADESQPSLFGVNQTPIDRVASQSSEPS